MVEDNSITKNDHIETIPVTFINPESNLDLSVGDCDYGTNVAAKKINHNDAQAYYLKRTTKNLWEIHSKQCPDYLVQIDGHCLVGEKIKLGGAVQKVKVKLEGTHYLHLADVQVFDYANNNVALSKQATQSSTFYTESAARALDGNVNTASHTNSDQGKHPCTGTTFYILFTWNTGSDFAVFVSNHRCMVGG